MRWTAVVALLLVVDASALSAAPLPAGLAIDEHAMVREVIDGDTVRLADGRTVRLAEIEAPKTPAEGSRAPLWPLAQAARSALAEMIEGREAGLAFGGAKSDRHNHLIAHLATKTGVWVEGEMLALGLARVYTEPDNRTAAAELLAIEAKARASRRGIWAIAGFRVLQPSDAARHLDSFQIVEGKVQRVEIRRGRVYINFGDDWRSDFTVMITPEGRRLFTTAGVDPAGFAAKALRVRGWIKSQNGPLIEATHPEQIEVLSK